MKRFIQTARKEVLFHKKWHLPKQVLRQEVITRLEAHINLQGWTK